jgi:L-iditol 2-dehydrogenase
MRPKTMKAVVKYENKPLATELREVPVPTITENEVLIEVAYIGVCGTDPHMHTGAKTFNYNCPFILGHEFAGIIVEAGNGVKNFKVGDRVTAETHQDYCGKCALCRSGNYHICRDRKGYGFHTNGAFTKYVAANERILHKVPDSVSLKVASITEPFCVAYKAVVCNTTVNPGDTVLVIGPGPIGLLCMEMAKHRGASEIIAVGAKGDDERLKLSKEYGATIAINGSVQDPLPTIMALGDKYGVDVVVDTAGPSETLKLSIDAVRPNGQIIKIGWGPKPVNFSLDPLMAKSATLRGHFSHTWDVWEKALVMMGKGQVNLDRVITHELPIDQWAHAFELVETKKAMKVVLTPID